MTDQHSPSQTQPADSIHAVARACVHLDAAAHQLETAAGDDVFSPLLGPASQLALIRGGIDPTIRAATDPGDRLDFIAHVDRALSLLDRVPASEAPPGLIVWAQRLHDMRDALLAAGTQQP